MLHSHFFRRRFTKIVLIYFKKKIILSTKVDIRKTNTKKKKNKKNGIVGPLKVVLFVKNCKAGSTNELSAIDPTYPNTRERTSHSYVCATKKI